MLDKPILVFGEILWDIFPDGKKLGGAPLNFSYYFQKQRGNPKLISAVGKDKLGEKALKQIKALGIDTSYIKQINKQTGRVEFSLYEKKHIFDIIRETAWEYIEYPWNNSLIENSQGLYFGTVSRNSEQNRKTLDKLLEKYENKLIFFDLNLRQGFYNLKDIRELIKRATYLKLNEEEVIILRNNKLIAGSTFKEMAYSLVDNYNLTGCCITLGSKGVIGGDKNQIIKVDGICAKDGGDSIGCGDAFSATWLACLLKGMGMKESFYKANKIGSRVASERGAIIEI
ncbi:MAG: PfkB family carbohydrate kinase [Nanoarchaeota archaeon]